MTFLKPYIKRYYKPFWLAILGLAIETVCGLIQPIIMSKIIDVGVVARDIHYVLNLGAVMLGVTCIGALAAVSRSIISVNVSQRFGSDIRLDLFKKINGFSFENIDKFETASLVTRLTNDITQVQNFANGLMRIFVKAPLICIGSIIMAIKLNAKMSLVLAVVVPVIAILIFFNMKVGYPFYNKIQKALDKVNGIMREYLSGVRVVKAFNRFNYEDKRFEISNESLSNISTSANRVMSIFSPSISLTVNLGIVVVLWVGGLSVNNGSMQVGEIIAFINYMTEILFSLMIISNVFTMFVRAKASLDRIGEVFEAKNHMIIKEKTQKLSSIKGGITFENVYFSYHGAQGEPVLKDISFNCNSGETIGIIGSTGSGKTTLVNLIPRFYDATSGRILIDGIDVKEMNDKDLRELIGIVPQKILLFTGTIEENITWGKETANTDEIIKASSIAQAHSFISSFPEEYDTKLGQGGVNLSGGQKQRISIARALVRKPKILILDDCTSAVDVTTEGKIREGLREYLKGMTSIIIAQRITSVIAADKIIVLDNGEIVGTGTHHELSETCEVYKDILRSQLGKEVV